MSNEREGRERGDYILRNPFPYKIIKDRALGVIPQPFVDFIGADYFNRASPGLVLVEIPKIPKIDILKVEGAGAWRNPA
jgi:hypothetical protein